MAVFFHIILIMTIQIISLNVQGLRQLNDRQILMDWINCCQPDIVCLQETHAKTDIEFTKWFYKNNIQINNKYN